MPAIDMFQFNFCFPQLETQFSHVEIRGINFIAESFDHSFLFLEFPFFTVVSLLSSSALRSLNLSWLAVAAGAPIRLPYIIMTFKVVLFRVARAGLNDSNSFLVFCVGGYKNCF
jgi:hypothetical protein